MNKESVEILELDLVNSVTSDNLKDLTLDIVESLIDTTLNDEIIKNIPILGSISKLYKIGLSIRDQYFAKKVFSFLFNIKDVSSENRLKFVKDLENFDTRQHVGETLIFLLDRFDNIQKPQILANLFKARVQNKINIENFLRLASIVEKAFLPDLKHLNEYIEYKSYCGHETESLKSLGLIYQSVIGSNGEDNQFLITILGQDILDFGIKSLQ